ncbi:hypothetical protein [Methylobacterium sp. P1-11]|uniref:hypothetical protein n=1 Tax=Methylobacterium sp. P1-11 TaxID=2024616 RepID=UPI001566DE27|nr:hypothetical protein [Methylobacterium sp. P1-11]
MLTYLGSCPAHHAALLCGIAVPLITFGSALLFIGAFEIAHQLFALTSSED